MSKQVLSDLDFNNVSKIINLPDATLPQHPATKAQLDASIQGLKEKPPVAVATQANINLAAPGAAIDGVTLSSGVDYVLVRSQTAGQENGIYLFNGSSSPMTRSVEMDTSAEFYNAITQVIGGTSAGTTFRCTTLNPTVGTTPVAFVTFGTSATAASETSAGIAEIATQAETDAGTDDLRFVTPLKLKTSSLLIKKYSSTFGDGAATQYDITHNLNSTDVEIRVYNVASGAEVICDNKAQSVNVVRLNFNTAPTSNALRCVVIG